MPAPFRDRTEAGQRLAKKLSHYVGRDDVVVLALPRGGVPVAFEVASSLRAPLDVFVVRKLGVPGHEELAMGAVATGGVMVLNESVLKGLDIGRHVIERVKDRETEELERRELLYRDGRPPIDVRDRTAILVDDGLATGSTMRAAVEALKRLEPARVVVATPVASASVCAQFEKEVDEVVCVVTPEPFYAVSYWYDDFAQTTDDEIRELIERAVGRSPSTEEGRT